MCDEGATNFQVTNAKKNNEIEMNLEKFCKLIR